MKRKVIIPLWATFVTILLSSAAFAADKVNFYHTDPAGTPIAMSDDTGAIVWKATYKPFGEEHSINPETIENNERFVGKEKDKETGLQYFGARYMKNEIGRFLSPDPVGPVAPRTSKTNHKMLTNPQRLNPYAYALNNPYRFVDPDGKWAQDVHSGVGRTYGTYTWAKQAGFSDKQARVIANGNNRTDSGPYSSFLPVTGDQSRHFNQGNVGDTRDYWANVEFQRAVKYAEDGDMNAALGHLGMICLLWLPRDGSLLAPSQKALIDQIPAALSIDLRNYLSA